MTLKQMNEYCSTFLQSYEKVKDIKITEEEVIIIYDITDQFKEKYDLYNKTRQLHININKKDVRDFAYIDYDLI